jgi:hypothetical protein
LVNPSANLGQLALHKRKRSRRPSQEACDAKNLGHNRPHVLGFPIRIVVSRSGITQMGHEVAQRLGLCAIGRARNKRFLCYTGAQRLQLQPQ